MAKDEILKAFESIIADVWKPTDPSRELTILDVGTGTGAILPILKKAGYRPWWHDCCWSVDQNITEAGFGALICDVTELGDKVGKPKDWDLCLCCDFLEHIPESIVDMAIGAVGRCCRLGAVFGISTFEDDGGLHVTLKDAEWWKEALEVHFDKVTQAKVGFVHPRQNPSNWLMFRCEHG